MSAPSNKFKIGLFLIVSFCALLLILFLAGLRKYFEPKIGFVTVVNQSVQGLDIGAKVKFKGVTIGKVTDIKVSSVNENIIIFMDFSPSSLFYGYGSKNLSEDKRQEMIKYLKSQVESGLRCQLRYEGITGSLYQDLLMFDPKLYPPMKDVILPPNCPDLYIPSQPAVLIGDLIPEIRESIEKFAKLDIDRLSVNLNNLTERMEKLMKEEKFVKALESVDQLPEQLTDINKSVTQLSDTLGSSLPPQAVPKFLEEASGTLAKMQKVSTSLDGQLKDIRKTLESMDVANMSSSLKTTFDSAQQAFSNIREISDELSTTLAHADRSIRSAQGLIETLEKDPGSVIYNKHSKPVVETR